ncbi:MAG TPA: carboxypeptidase-like regulatory domain-containing protein, partial [Terriglobia bacterium]|nr:carboxypeptidase-like regulatory domain-containing protein [Terriglobia bacterium]
TSGNQNVFADRNFPPTYYPGTLDPSRASILDLQPGTELSAVDFVLAQPATFRIRGRVVDPTTGKHPQNASVSISPRQEAGATGIVVATGMASSATYNNATGTFEIRSVIPGLYWLRASISTDLNQPINLNVAGTARTAMELVESVLLGNSRSAQIPIEVGNSDVEGATLTLTPGLSIPMYVQFEGQQLSSITGLDRVRVNLRPTTPGAPAPYQALSFNAEGTTTLTNVSPGEYRVQASPPSTDMYLKEVLFDRQDVLNRPWEITNETSGALTVIFSNKGGQIEGNLVDTLSQPVRGTQVVLVPDQGRDRPELYKTASTDQNGRFIFRGLAPGGYRLYAWEVIEANSWYDRDVLAEHESRSTPVRVKESTTETVELKVIPAPK